MYRCCITTIRKLYNKMSQKLGQTADTDTHIEGTRICPVCKRTTKISIDIEE